MFLRPTLDSFLAFTDDDLKKIFPDITEEHLHDLENFLDDVKRSMNYVAYGCFGITVVMLAVFIMASIHMGTSLFSRVCRHPFH
jgi:hypothetical protein